MGSMGLKLLALVLALAVYVHVFSGRVQEMVFRVPLVVDRLPTTLALASPPPDEVKVRVRGYGKDLLKLRARSFKAEVRLESPRKGVFQRPVLGSDMRFPEGIQPLSVEVLEPHLIELRIEDAARRVLPIRATLVGSLPEDRALASLPRAEPAQVAVSGPESVLDTLQSISTAPVSLENIHGDFSSKVALALPAGVASDPGSVRLSIELEERLTRQSAPLPIVVNAPLGIRIASVEPESARVVVSGAVSVVGQLDLSSPRLTADVARRIRGPARVAVQARIPALPHPAPVTLECVPESCTVTPR